MYTTGSGFPPIIQGIPQAMKGIATAFLLALLTGIINDLQDSIAFTCNTVYTYAFCIRGYVQKLNY